MSVADQFLLALTAWRENRGGGVAGMQSVINVICNRALKRGTTPYAECVRRLQFSSITATGDPELTLWPALDDKQFAIAQQLVAAAAAGTLEDITGGAVDYYAPHAIESDKTITLPDGQTFPFPAHWNLSAVTFTREVANQLFFK